MKVKMILLLLLLPMLALTQEERSIDEVEGRRSVSMDDVNGSSLDGVYRYYALGEDEPFSGILFSKYENGEYNSWQQFEEGIGEGQWINYYDNGNYREIGNYNQNKVEGPIQKFYEDGTLQAEGTYKDWRIRIGKWTYYDESGYLIETKDYGQKGSIEEVKAYYDRGEISYSWYSSILTDNGFDL